eukprot:1195032-Prorocentrum_minimum.AAC.1
MEATPAKWKVFSVICVPGSPMDCAPTAPTALAGSTFLARPGHAGYNSTFSAWYLAQETLHPSSTDPDTQVTTPQATPAARDSARKSDAKVTPGGRSRGRTASPTSTLAVTLRSPKAHPLLPTRIDTRSPRVIGLSYYTVHTARRYEGSTWTGRRAVPAKRCGPPAGGGAPPSSGPPPRGWLGPACPPPCREIRGCRHGTAPSTSPPPAAGPLPAARPSAPAAPKKIAKEYKKNNRKIAYLPTSLNSARYDGSALAPPRPKGLKTDYRPCTHQGVQYIKG